MIRSTKYIIVFLLFVTALYSVEIPNCLNFHGADEYVHIDDSPLRFTWRFTIECWFNIHEFSDSSALIDYSSLSINQNNYFGYGIYTMDSNRIAIRLGNQSNQVEMILPDIKPGIWQHLAVTYNKYKNDENLIAFLNGRTVKKTNCDFLLQYPETFRPYGVYLGAFYDYPYHKAVKGELDEVRFWNVVRTNEEILNSMDLRIDSESTGLVGYYTFNQEPDSLLHDLSLYENHGKLENMSDSCWHLSYAQVATIQPNDISFDRFVLSWIATPDFDSYYVDMSEDENFTSSCDGFPVEDIKTSYYIVDEITPGSYYYRVKGHYDGVPLNSEPWTDIQSVSTVTDAATAIELSEFELIPQNGYIHIHWQSSSQTENSKFIIEKKTANTNWQTIYEIPGAGTNSIAIDYEFDDLNIIPGITYYYRIMDLDYNGNLDSSSVLSSKMNGDIISDNTTFVLNEIYPNPFNPETTISFSILRDTEIHMSIYSSNGQLVDIIAGSYYHSGDYKLTWNPTGLATGIYVLKINSTHQTTTSKLLYMK